MASFTFSDAALISATLLGPVLAIQVQKLLERVQWAKDRRNGIFRTLMATRAARLSLTHVEALNMINIEFSASNRDFKKVRSAWKAYLSHLGERVPDDLQVHPVYFAKREELFTDLLYEMGTSLGYDFDKTQIAKEAYSTVFQEKLEADVQMIRTKLVEILTGKSSLPMNVVSFPVDEAFAANQLEYARLLVEHIRDGRAWPVQIVGDTGKVVPLRPTPDQQSPRPQGTTDAASKNK